MINHYRENGLLLRAAGNPSKLPGHRNKEILQKAGAQMASRQESRERGGGYNQAGAACSSQYVVVVYHVTIVAIGHGLLKKFWPFGTRLRSTHCREFNYLILCRPAYFIRTTQLLNIKTDKESLNSTKILKMQIRKITKMMVRIRNTDIFWPGIFSGTK